MYVVFSDRIFAAPSSLGHTYGIGVVKAQARLCICTGWPESSHGRLCDKYHFLIDILTGPYCSMLFLLGLRWITLITTLNYSLWKNLRVLVIPNLYHNEENGRTLEEKYIIVR